jgi:hypothetical protein
VNTRTGKMNPVDIIALKARMADNLQKTFDLIELHQGLKFALYKKLHPEKNDREIRWMIGMANLKMRSENAVGSCK